MAREFASELFIGHPGGDAGKGCRTPDARLRDGAAKQVRQQAAFGTQNPIELRPAAPGNDLIGWAGDRCHGLQAATHGVDSVVDGRSDDLIRRAGVVERNANFVDPSAGLAHADNIVP